MADQSSLPTGPPYLSAMPEPPVSRSRSRGQIAWRVLEMVVGVALFIFPATSRLIDEVHDRIFSTRAPVDEPELDASLPDSPANHEEMNDLSHPPSASSASSPQPSATSSVPHTYVRSPSSVIVETRARRSSSDLVPSASQSDISLLGSGGELLQSAHSGSSASRVSSDRRGRVGVGGLLSSVALQAADRVIASSQRKPHPPQGASLTTPQPAASPTASSQRRPSTGLEEKYPSSSPADEERRVASSARGEQRRRKTSLDDLLASLPSEENPRGVRNTHSSSSSLSLSDDALRLEDDQKFPSAFSPIAISRLSSSSSGDSLFSPLSSAPFVEKPRVDFSKCESDSSGESKGNREERTLEKQLSFSELQEKFSPPGTSAGVSFPSPKSAQPRLRSKLDRRSAPFTLSRQNTPSSASPFSAWAEANAQFSPGSSFARDTPQNTMRRSNRRTLRRGRTDFLAGTTPPGNVRQLSRSFTTSSTGTSTGTTTTPSSAGLQVPLHHRRVLTSPRMGSVVVVDCPHKGGSRTLPRQRRSLGVPDSRPFSLATPTPTPLKPGATPTPGSAGSSRSVASLASQFLQTPSPRPRKVMVSMGTQSVSPSRSIAIQTDDEDFAYADSLPLIPPAIPQHIIDSLNTRKRLTKMPSMAEVDRTSEVFTSGGGASKGGSVVPPPLPSHVTESAKKRQKVLKADSTGRPVPVSVPVPAAAALPPPGASAPLPAAPPPGAAAPPPGGAPPPPGVPMPGGGGAAAPPPPLPPTNLMGLLNGAAGQPSDLPEVKVSKPRTLCPTCRVALVKDVLPPIKEESKSESNTADEEKSKSADKAGSKSPESVKAAAPPPPVAAAAAPPASAAAPAAGAPPPSAAAAAAPPPGAAAPAAAAPPPPGAAGAAPPPPGALAAAAAAPPPGAAGGRAAAPPPPPPPPLPPSAPRLGGKGSRNAPASPRNGPKCAICEKPSGRVTYCCETCKDFRVCEECSEAKFANTVYFTAVPGSQFRKTIFCDALDTSASFDVQALVREFPTKQDAKLAKKRGTPGGRKQRTMKRTSTGAMKGDDGSLQSGGGEKRKRKAPELIDSNRRIALEMPLKRRRYSPLSPQEIVDLLCYDLESVAEEDLEPLKNGLPKPEELAKLGTYEGDINDLSRPEAFGFLVARVPSLKQRLEARLFQLNFRGNIKELDNEIKVLTAGIDCFYKDDMKTFFAALLELVNIINKPAGRVAYGFAITSLDRMFSMKANCEDRSSSSRRRTILNFFVDQYSKNHPGCREPLSAIKATIANARTMDQKGLRDNVKLLADGISKIVHYLQTAEADPALSAKKKTPGRITTAPLKSGGATSSVGSKDSDKKDGETPKSKEEGGVAESKTGFDTTEDSEAKKAPDTGEKSAAKPESETRSPLRNVIIETEARKDPFVRSLKKFYGMGREESARVQAAFQEANARLDALVEYCGENKNTTPEQVFAAMDKFLAHYLKIDQENIDAAEKKAKEARRKPVPALQAKKRLTQRRKVKIPTTRRGKAGEKTAGGKVGEKKEGGKVGEKKERGKVGEKKVGGKVGKKNEGDKAPTAAQIALQQMRAKRGEKRAQSAGRAVKPTNESAGAGRAVKSAKESASDGRAVKSANESVGAGNVEKPAKESTGAGRAKEPARETAGTGSGDAPAEECTGLSERPSTARTVSFSLSADGAESSAAAAVAESGSAEESKESSTSPAGLSPAVRPVPTCRLGSSNKTSSSALSESGNIEESSSPFIKESNRNRHRPGESSGVDGALSHEPLHLASDAPSGVTSRRASDAPSEAPSAVPSDVALGVLPMGTSSALDHTSSRSKTKESESLVEPVPEELVSAESVNSDVLTLPTEKSVSQSESSPVKSEVSEDTKEPERHSELAGGPPSPSAGESVPIDQDTEQHSDLSQHATESQRGDEDRTPSNAVEAPELLLKVSAPFESVSTMQADSSSHVDSSLRPLASAALLENADECVSVLNHNECENIDDARETEGTSREEPLRVLVSKPVTKVRASVSSSSSALPGISSESKTASHTVSLTNVSSEAAPPHEEDSLPAPRSRPSKAAESAPVPPEADFDEEEAFLHSDDDAGSASDADSLASLKSVPYSSSSGSSSDGDSDFALEIEAMRRSAFESDASAASSPISTTASSPVSLGSYSISGASLPSTAASSPISVTSPPVTSASYSIFVASAPSPAASPPISAPPSSVLAASSPVPAASSPRSAISAASPLLPVASSLPTSVVEDQQSAMPTSSALSSALDVPFSADFHGDAALAASSSGVATEAKSSAVDPVADHREHTLSPSRDLALEAYEPFEREPRVSGLSRHATSCGESESKSSSSFTENLGNNAAFQVSSESKVSFSQDESFPPDRRETSAEPRSQRSSSLREAFGELSLDGESREELPDAHARSLSSTEPLEERVQEAEPREAPSGSSADRASSSLLRETSGGLFSDDSAGSHGGHAERRV